MVFLLYYALLAVWPLLLWPAWRLAGRSRAWLLIVALAGLLATAHEIRILTGPPAAIRLDVFLIIVVLGVLYASAALVMFRGRWRKSATALVAVSVLAGGAMTYIWFDISRGAERLTGLIQARNVLLFEAKFSSLDAYSSYFRTFDARPTLLPVGHWEAPPGGYYSRLIVNPEGRAWVFFHCDESECMYEAVDSDVQVLGDPAQKRWEITLAPRAGAPLVMLVAQSGPDQLTLAGGPLPTTFNKTPPPINPTPAHQSLNFLGPFVQVECQGRVAAVRQFWLWQEDARLYAVGIFRTLLAGERANFISPIVLGEGVREGDSWSFEWRQDRQSWKARIALEDAGDRLTLERDGELVARAGLERKGVFRDAVIELAPLTSKADWDHWFDIVMLGHHSSGDVPAC